MKQTPKFVTKFFAAIDSYADIKAENEQQALDLSQAARDTIKPIIEQHNGVWMHEKNGEIFANFKLPEDAVNCAVALQREMSDHPDVKLRIGIHTGDIKSGIGTGDIVASGIAKKASSGGVCISDKVYASIQKTTDITAEYLEDVKPAGVEHAVRVYSLTVPGLQEPAAVVSGNSKADNRQIRPSIAVLPFRDMSPDKDQDYFCEGITEEIINALTHVEDLKVIARTSAFAFKGKQEDIREIGKKLDVVNLLEGSVRKAGNRLRITAQLVNVLDGSHLWSEKYDRTMEDIFAIQDEISLAIVEVLKVKLLKTEKATVVKRHTKDTEAYNLYLLGRYHWIKRSEEGLNKAIVFFQKALDKDPNYALAYTGIADSYNVLGNYLYLSPEEAYSKAKNAALKALEIDDDLSEAHTSLALNNLWGDWDFPAAERGFKRALALNPDYTTAHIVYGVYFLIMGKFNRALNEFMLAQKSDPLSLLALFCMTTVYHYWRKYNEAIEQFKKAIEINPNQGIFYFTIGQTYANIGNYNEAIAAFKKSIELTGSLMMEAWLGYTYAQSGEKEKTKRILNELLEKKKEHYISSTSIAIIYISLKEIDKAFEWLETAYEEHDTFLLYLNSLPESDPIRPDPRYKALLKKMNFPVD